MRRRTIKICSFFLLIVFIVAGCASPRSGANSKVWVATSFYPLSYFVGRIGGDVVDIHQVGNNGSNAHSFEPQTHDIAMLEKSDIFFYNGYSFDYWAEKYAEQNPHLSVSVLGRVHDAHPELILGSTEDAQEGEEGSASFDPHAWLDPVIASEYVRVIANELTRVSPENESVFREHARSLEQDLNDVHMYYRTRLTGCAENTLFVSHNFLSYPSKRYGFDVVSIAGISPDDQPSAQEFGRLVGKIKEKNIHYVFVEEFSNPDLSNALAREANVETRIINPLEGITAEEQTHGDDYLSIMKTNAEQIARGLNCGMSGNSALSK